MRKVAKAAGVSAVLLAALQQPVHAYIDPGSASYAFQIITGGVLGGLFLLKTYWGKLKGSFRNGVSRVRRPKA